ncbi:MAG: ABC transporter substrate-binding protein [Candidatus Thermoplasmatota archaeon]|nr:ABC transporter substrate-binding protein [Candidatus Thermoplasmatota archaeon]
MEKKTTLLISIVIAAAVVVATAGVALYLTPDDDDSVKYVVVSPTLMGGWLQGGDGSAYIAWEPFVSSATVGGYGTVLSWSNEIMPNHPCCVVVLSNEFASTTEGSELSLRFLKAHVESTEWILDALADKDSVEYQLLVNMSVAFTLRDADVVENALEHVKFGWEMDTEFRSALDQFTDMYIDAGIVEEETVGDRGYGNVTDFISSYVNGTYLDELGSVTESPAILNPDDPIRLGYLAGDIHQLAQYVAANGSVVGGTMSVFEKYGLNVVAATGAPYANGGSEMDAFVAGHVDIGYLGAPPAILKKLNVDADTTIIAQVNSEGSAIVIATGSQISSLADLSGKIVATPGESSIQHLLLKIALNEQGLKLVKA